MNTENDYYKQILTKEIVELSHILAERQDLDLKVAQKEQLIRATLNFLPDAERFAFESTLSEYLRPQLGLSDSIRSVLKSAPKKWHTASEVREALVKSGFDFSGYTTNPLASVHAALKRLKADEAEMTEIDGVMAWRAKQALAPYKFRRKRNNPYLDIKNKAIQSVLGISDADDVRKKIFDNLYGKK
jgi:hypothetical protein